MSSGARSSFGVPVVLATCVVLAGAASPRMAGGRPERWRGTPITITLDPSLDDVRGDAKNAVRKSVAAWLDCGAALPAVTFEPGAKHGSAERDGKNLVLVAPITVAGHEQDVAMTISQVDDSTGEILESDVILNSAYAFGVLSAPTEDDAQNAACDGRTYDVENVATHELGHFFGLGEDTKDQEATMYTVSLPCQTHKRALTQADVSAMTSLYATPLASSRATAVDPGAGGSMGCGGSL